MSEHLLTLQAKCLDDDTATLLQAELVKLCSLYGVDVLELGTERLPRLRAVPPVSEGDAA